MDILALANDLTSNLMNVVKDRELEAQYRRGFAMAAIRSDDIRRCPDATVNVSGSIPRACACDDLPNTACILLDLYRAPGLVHVRGRMLVVPHKVRGKGIATAMMMAIDSVLKDAATKVIFTASPVAMESEERMSSVLLAKSDFMFAKSGHMISPIPELWSPSDIKSNLLFNLGTVRSPGEWKNIRDMVNQSRVKKPSDLLNLKGGRSFLSQLNWYGRKDYNGTPN